MPRKPRGHVPAGVYHVWRRATGPIEMFRDDVDRSAFCRRLTKSTRKHGVTCIAFVLMPTHFHLVVEVEDETLPLAVRDFFGPYAQEFNRRHRRSGHLRAEPFKLRIIRTDSALRTVVRYAARNPVRAGLCAEPQDWTWSSYAGSAGYTKPFAFVDDALVIGSIHEDVRKARHLFRDIVEPPV